MRILHTESSQGWGGQEIRILVESQCLLKKGHSVSILADPDSAIARNAQRYGVEIVPVRLKRKKIYELREVISAINRLQPDVISAHSSTDHWLVAIARILAKYKPPVVRTRHISARVHRNLPTKWLYRSGCEAIVTTGAYIRNHLLDDGFVSPEKVRSIPTGIDLAHFCPTDKKEARRRLSAEFPIRSDALLFGNIATLRSWKGQHDLIRAFFAALPRLGNAQLLIVGDGPQRESLQKLANTFDHDNHVVFCGQQQDVRDYFDALDIFVFPSYANEGVPQAILQAISYGLTIITTRVGAIEEAVAEYPQVQFVTPRDTSDLAAALVETYKNGTDRILPSSAIKDRIGINRMTDEMLKTYFSVLPILMPSKPL